MSSQLLTTYLKNLKKIGLERNIPNISEANAEYIKQLIRAKKPKHILEIGTANGYSTLQFASMHQENFQKQEVRGREIVSKGVCGFANDGETNFSDNEIRSFSEFSTITTIEYAWNAHIEAVEHFRNCKMKHIHAIWGDAKEVIPTLAENYFDFVCIDAMKREYLDYLLLALPKMTRDALIVIDDVEKFRNKMENLYSWLSENHVPYTLEQTDIDDSIMIIERRYIL